MKGSNPLEQIPRIVIAVDLDYFYAQCEEVRRPDLKTKPVVICVFSGRTETSGAVSTANYIGRELGVKSGIPIALARKILGKREDAQFLPMDREYYDSVSERIMEILRSYSFKFEQVSVDEAFLDVGHLTKGNYEAAASIGNRIKERVLTEESLTSSVGIGPNKLIAKMAADLKKPDGLTVIPEVQAKEFLSDMPVRKLMGVGPKIEAKLQSLGIKTISDLSNYAPEVLAKELGKNLGPHFRDLANGIDNDPVVEKPIEQLSRIITLKSDADTFSFEKELEPLVEDLSARLKKLDLKSRTIGIIAITTELRTKNRAVTLDTPTDSNSVMGSSARDLFLRFFTTKSESGVKIRRVGIRLSGLEKTFQKETEGPTLEKFLQK